MAEPTVYGMPAPDLPDRWTPLEAVCVLTALDEEGNTALLVRATDALSAWEAIGMLEAASHIQKGSFADGYETEFGDDNEEDDDA